MDRICRHIAFLNNSAYINGNAVNLNQEDRYRCTLDQITVEGDVSTRFIKQRSAEWHDVRSKAKVTGSTLYQGVGCDGLAKQKSHFERVICGVAEKEPSETVQQAMQHGVDNGENAIGTFVGKVMPVLTPDLIFCEEGCVVVEDEEGKTFLVVSPDGSLRRNVSLDSTEVVIEIKCPMKKAHTEFPARYLLQCLAEIHVLKAKYLLYISWKEDVTTVFKVARNDALLAKALKISMDLYGTDRPKKPTKLAQTSKELKHEIEKESKEVTFIGRFTSCKVSDAPNEYDNDAKTFEALCELLKNICTCYKDCHELQRMRATEAVVFLVSDLDRSWKKNTTRCSAVGWFPKGYSLDTGTMREIAEEVHTLCHKGGIHVPCESFDGQWHLLVVRDAAGEPLTLFQLQKDIWKSVESKSKKEILDEIKRLNKTATWTMIMDFNITNISHKYIQATNGGFPLPKYRHIQPKNVKVTRYINDHNVSNEITLMDTVPDLVRETAGIGEDVMAMTIVRDVEELEAFSNNTNDEEWSRELEDTEITAVSDENDNIDINSEHKSNDTCNVARNDLDLKDMECILSMFMTTKDCNRNLQWNNVTPDSFLEYFESYERLRQLLDIELRIIVRYLKKSKGMKGVKESNTKKIKLDGIARYLRLNITDTSKGTKYKKKAPVRNIGSLQDLAAKAVSKYSKPELNVILAEHLFESRYRSWVKPVENVKINGESFDWFYKPEYCKSRDQFEVKCIDSTHLLTRARRKTCAGGIEGISNEPWMKVAKQRSTLLTPIMVEDISDPMSVSMAKTHFSESVEIQMRKNGDIQAADLCSDVRKWWESEDTPGIPASYRIELRKALRRRLMSKAIFTRFPPPTQYVCGWPVQLWEGLLASMDAKAYLYAMVHGGTYNVRAFSSLIGETFFSELVLNDKRGQGTVSALEFGQYIGYTTEQLQIRLDQERKFAFCTSKTKVYDTVDESYDCESAHEHETCRICKGEKGVVPQSIDTRDHMFDMSQRKRLKGRRNREHVPLERNAIQRGSLGVRWEKARCNMAKMLSTKRMGIPDV